MRISSQRTPVAVLRNIIGQKTSEFAEMVGLSLSAVEKLESGRLKLSEEVAQKISFETGVDPHWLLEGDPGMPPHLDIAVRDYLSGQRNQHRKDYQEARYTKEVFDRVRVARLAKESPIAEGEHTREEQIVCLLFRLMFIYESARSDGEEVMALYRLHRIEGDLAEQFGLSVNESAFERALNAVRCLQKLANRLKCDQKDLSTLSFPPGKVDPINDKRPVKFLQFCHKTAKAIRAINESRKGSSKGKRRKARRVQSEGETDAQVDAPAPHPLTEDEIRDLFAPVRKRMEAKGYSEKDICKRLDKFRKRQRAGEDDISPP